VKSSCKTPFLSSALRQEVVNLSQSRTYREEKQLFLADGMRFVSQALASRWTQISYALVCPPLLAPLGREQQKELERRQIPVYNLPPAEFRAISQVKEPQGIALCCRQRYETLTRMGAESGLCALALDTIQSTGNLGTILRTFDAVGGNTVILLGESIDPYDPTAVRATMGSHFQMRFARATPASFQQWRRERDVTLVGTTPHATQEYTHLAYPTRTVLWLGGERKGLSAEQQEFCDTNVAIPMVGHADSLNVAAAAAVLLYEIFRQRRLE
jgi:RNA methyltransferase, TrmH family